MKTILPLLAAAALSTGSSHADQGSKTAAKTAPKAAGEAAGEQAVGLLFEWIELDHRQANKLIRKHAIQLDADPLREALETLLDKGEASLVETAYLVSNRDRKSQVTSVDELLYPTEFDPPEIPQKIHKDMPLDQIPIGPANPTAFDVRNVGTTVTAEITVNRSGSIKLDLNPEIVRHLGDRTIGDAKTLHASLAHVYQPDFYVMSLATQLTLDDGKHSLISLFTPAGKKDKRVMLIARAKILK